MGYLIGGFVAGLLVAEVYHLRYDSVRREQLEWLKEGVPIRRGNGNEREPLNRRRETR